MSTADHHDEDPVAGPSSSSSAYDYNHDDHFQMMRKMSSSASGSIYSSWGWGSGGVSEIEEAEEEEEQYSSGRVFDETKGGMVGVHQALDTIREEDQVMVEGGNSSLFSFDFHSGDGGSEDAVYVALLQQGNGKGASADNQDSSSMDALLWALNHAVHFDDASSSTTVVFLVLVFPDIKHIPTPLGMMPMSQVNPEQKENYMTQERGKRREFLDKYLNACSTAKVKVDTIIIESDKEAKAILDLIPILNITKLVLGTTKTNLRKMRSRRATGVIDQIVRGAPEFCEVKIICEGKEVLDSMITDSPSPSPSPSPRATYTQNQEHLSAATTESFQFRCGCFKPKVLT